MSDIIAGSSSVKYRVAMLLSLIFVVIYYLNKVNVLEFAKCAGIAFVLTAAMLAVIIRLDVVNCVNIGGVGAIVFAVSMLAWKKIHLYSIYLECILALTVMLLGVILSFKYTASELEGRHQQTKREK